MKTLLLCILLFTSGLITHAQSVQNPNFRYSYVTFAQGYIVLSCESLASCGTLDVNMKWGSKDTTLQFQPLEMRQVMLPSPGGSLTVQAKTTANCNNGFNGPWLALSLTALALREDTRFVHPASVPPGFVRVVAINGTYLKDMREAEFQQRRNEYRQHYYIIRRDKPKELIL